MSGTIRNKAEGECIVNNLLQYCLVHPCSSCGKCTFGYEGVTQLQMILRDLTEKKGNISDIALMKDLCSLMVTESICEEGTELAKDVLYVLDNYEEEFRLHATGKECPSGICRAFMTFHVLASKCNGCGDCEDICEDDAILGRKNYIHVIDRALCSQCGKCLPVCDRSAIVMAGARKPKGPSKPVPVKR